MKYRQIRHTNLRVSEVGFGVWSLATPQSAGRPKEDPEHLLKYALDRGINFFETADIYGFGHGEDLIGNILLDERDRIFLATRVGYEPKPSKEPSDRWQRSPKPNLSPKYVKSACEASLKRLRTDHIDLYQVHHPDISSVERDDLYEVLEKLKKKGKIVEWGACLANQTEWFEEAKFLSRLRKVACSQISYDLLNPYPGREVIKEVRRKKTSLVIRMPEKQEVLEKLAMISDLHFLAQSSERSLWQSVLKFSLSDPAVSSVLIDITSEEQINELACISECPDLSLSELKAISHWHKKKDQSESVHSQASVFSSPWLKSHDFFGGVA